MRYQPASISKVGVSVVSTFPASAPSVRLGERRRYEPGGGMLAARSGFPVVPVAHNAGVFWPRRSLIKYPGTINVVIGPVIDPAGKSATDITAIAEDWMEATCERLAASPGRA